MRSLRPLAPYRRVLAQRPFAALWAAQAISNVGDALYNVALLWYVLDRTGSALAAGGIAVAAGVGGTLGGLAAAACLDRLPPRRVLLVADGARLVATAAVALPWLLGAAPPLAFLYALAATGAVAGAWHGPARAATMPRVVPPGDLVAANALEGVAANLTNTLVWALSGAVVAVLGPAAALALDAATFFAAFLAIRAVALPGPVVGTRARPSAHRAEVLAGFRAIGATPALRGFFGLLPLHALAGGCFFAGLAPFLRQQLGGGAALYGLQGAAYGTGIVLASALLGAAATRRVGPLYADGVLVNALGNVGFALAPSVPALLAAALVAGLGVAALAIGELALLQTVAPPASRGRILALATLLGGGLFPVGVALGGWLADGWRAQPVLLVAALVHVALGLRLPASPALRAVASADGGPADPRR